MLPSVSRGVRMGGRPGRAVTRFVMRVNPCNIGDLPELPDESALLLSPRSKFYVLPFDRGALENLTREPQQPVTITFHGSFRGRAEAVPGSRPCVPRPPTACQAPRPAP